jgi:hypothetical protein
MEQDHLDVNQPSEAEESQSHPLKNSLQDHELISNTVSLIQSREQSHIMADRLNSESERNCGFADPESCLCKPQLQKSETARLENGPLQTFDPNFKSDYFRDSPSQTEDLRVIKIRPANIPVFHSGLLWAAYLLCLLLSGVQSPYPATSVVTVSANTGTSGPTYVNSQSYCIPPLYVAASSKYLYACSTYQNSNYRLFWNNPDLSVQMTAFNPGFNSVPTVLKDSLILVVTGHSTYDAVFDLITISGATITTSRISTTNIGRVHYALIKQAGTDYLIGTTSTSEIYRYLNNDWTIVTQTTTGAMNGKYTHMALEFSTVDALIVVVQTGVQPILARSNFATIKNPTTTWEQFFGLVDNLGDDLVVYFTKTPNWRLRGYSRATWLTDADLYRPEFVMDSFGAPNNILNFGPYQYVVTIPSTPSAIGFVMVVSKLTFTLLPPLNFVSSAPFQDSPHWGDFARILYSGTYTINSVVYTYYEANHRYLFYLQDATSKNFQSYYLTVSDCTSRDSNRVCQTCQSGLVRNNLMPDNVCLVAADYTGYVADTVNTLLSLCPGNSAAPVGVGCRATDCTGGTTYCTTCDVANSFYLLNGVCYVYASIPDGYGIVTVGNQQLGPCTDAGCRRCRSNNTICEICNYTASFYMRTSDSVCVHTANIEDGLGANFGLNSYYPCIFANCLKCGPNMHICLRCNNTAGYYNYTAINQCTLAYTMPNGLGANLITYQIEACVSPNCLNCTSDITNCIICDWANSYYMNTTTNLCQHLSLTPNGFGINTVTKAYVACNDPNCFNCFNDHTVCAQCNTTSGYYLNTNTSTCVLYSTAPDGYGANLVSIQLEPCADPNCQLCKANILTCDQCYVANSFYMNTTSLLCQSTATANEGFGINAVAKSFQQCTLANCRFCLSNYASCTQCNDTGSYYLNGTSGQCQHVSTASPGFGIKIATFSYAACTIVNCQNCLSDYTICNTCNVAAGYYMNTNTTTCQLYTTSPWGYGANQLLSTLAPCSDTHCALCQADITVCTQCDTATGYYMNSSLPQCVHTSAANEGYGIDGLAYSACQLANCRQCLANFAACTRCNDTAGYYMDGGVCVHTSAVANGKGANLATFGYQLCTDPNCLNCAQDYTGCALCNTPLSYFRNTTAQVCQPLSTVQDGYGVNPSTFVYEPCTDPHCQKCAADKNVCTQCWIDQFYYMNTTSMLCQKNDTFAEGNGANLVNFNIEPCTDVNCRDCVVNKAVCAKCNDTAGYYMNTSSVLCQHTSTAADFFGVNLTSFNYDACVDPFCQKCLLNNSNCTLCDVGNGYNMNLTTLLCQLWPTVEDGHGVNSLTNQLEPCTDPHCQKCAADKNNCTQCYIGQFYYMNTTTNLCLALNESNPGYRIANGTYYEPCDDPNCKDCQENRTICKLCQTNRSYYMNNTNLLCELNTTQPDGFGVDVGNYSYRACADEHCQVCIKNYSNCTACNETAKYFMNETSLKCESNETRAKGFRIHEDGHYEHCSIKFCNNCEKDRDVCTFCDPESGFYLIQNSCVMRKSNSSISQTTLFKASTSRASVVFGGGVSVDASWADQLDIILLDELGNKTYVNKSLYKFYPRDSGFEIEILYVGFMERARLYFRKPETPVPALDRRRLQLSTIPDNILPIVVGDFTLLNEAAQKAAAAAAAESADQMGNQRTVANVVLMNVNMNAATLLDRMIADYEYQALIGKQNLTYTRLLLDPALEVKLAPFDLPGTDEETKEGYIERKLKTKGCEVQYFYFRNGVKCGFFENYGSDFVTLLGFLVINILVSLLGQLLRKKKILDEEMKEPFNDATLKEILLYQANTLGCKLTVTFGLQFFFVKLEGNAVKLLLFALLNIYKMEGTWQMGVGFVASVIVLVYFGLYLYFAWSFARHLKEAIIKDVKEKQERANFRFAPIKESLKLHNIRFGFMGKPYEELRNDLNFFEIYYPVVMVLRSILITSSIVLLTGSPHVAPIMTMLVEIGVFFYCLLARARAKRIENALDVFNCICRIAYSLMAALTFRFDIIPPALDMAMFLTLLLNTGGSLFITICIMVLTVYDILVLLFKKSAFTGRYKTSEDRIKESFGKTVLKYRTEFLNALQRNPDKLIERHMQIHSAHNSNRLNSLPEAETEPILRAAQGEAVLEPPTGNLVTSANSPVRGQIELQPVRPQTRDVVDVNDGRGDAGDKEIKEDEIVVGKNTEPTVAALKEKGNDDC